jgi:hypothetical protein
MPLYFFIIRTADGEVDDPDGTRLPGDADALRHATRLVEELLRGKGPPQAKSTLIVKNAAGVIVHSIPI